MAEQLELFEEYVRKETLEERVKRLEKELTELRHEMRIAQRALSKGVR